MTNTTIPDKYVNTIVEGCTNSVRKIIRKDYAHLFSEDDINDTIADAQYSVCRSFPSFDPAKGELFSWVYKTSRNCVLDAVDRITKQSPLDDDIERTTKKGKTVNVSDERGYTDRVWDADSTLSTDEFYEQLDKAAATLTDTQRKCFEMTIAGYKPREIAAELGISASAASMGKFHAIEKVRPLLRELADDYGIRCDKLSE